MKNKLRIPLLLMAFLVSCLSCLPSAFAKETLKAHYNGMTDEKLETVLASFYETYPDYEVVFEGSKDEAQILNRFLLRDSEWDVYYLTTRYGFIETLKGKGYYVDLSGLPAVKERMPQIDPLYAPLFMDGEAVCAYPAEVLFDYLFFWEDSVADKLDFTRDDIPKTLDALIALAKRVEESGYVDIAVMYNSSANPLMYPVLGIYRSHSLSEYGTLRFDTPAFEALLQTLSRFTKPAGEFDPAEGTLLACTTSSDSQAALGTSWYTVPFVLKASDDVPPVVPIAFKCYMINPYGKHPEQAKALINLLIEAQDEAEWMALAPTSQTPLEDPHYQQNVDGAQSMIGWIESMLSLENLENEGYYERLLESELARLETVKANRFIVTEDSLARYRREIEPYRFIMGQTIYETPLIDTTIYSLYAQYINGAITMDELLMDLKKKVIMIALENQ